MKAEPNKWHQITIMEALAWGAPHPPRGSPPGGRRAPAPARRWRRCTGPPAGRAAS